MISWSLAFVLWGFSKTASARSSPVTSRSSMVCRALINRRCRSRRVQIWRQRGDHRRSQAERRTAGQDSLGGQLVGVLSERKRESREPIRSPCRRGSGGKGCCGRQRAIWTAAGLGEAVGFLYCAGGRPDGVAGWKPLHFSAQRGHQE